jgi:integrase
LNSRKPVNDRTRSQAVPTQIPQTPSLRHHRSSGRAVVTLNGRDVYLGNFGSAESRAEYDRVIGEWMINGRRLPVANGGARDITVNEMLVAYLRHADSYYVKHGEPTREPEDIRYAVRPLRELYGHTLARDFGPLSLKTVRQRMIAQGWSRNVINQRLGKVKRAFKFAVSEELIPPSVFHGLSTVTGLRHGRSDVRDTEPVKPVPEAFIDAVKPFVSRAVSAMIELQRLTGMRPGEVIAMRTVDLDVSGKVWVYIPQSHKTEHHGRSRVIYLGPRAQDAVRPWLRTDLTAPLFQPREAEAERKVEMRTNRKTRVQPSQADRSKSRPKRQPGESYAVEGYRRAIARACGKASVPSWHPHRLRHNAATAIRREFGLDVARAVLGHSTADATLRYAEMDGAKASDAMLKLG